MQIHLDKMHSLPNLFLRVRWTFLREYGPDWHIPLNAEPYTVFWYILSGSKTVFFNGREQRLQAGNLLIVPPHTSFAFIASENDGPIRYLSLIQDARIGPYHIVEHYGLPIVSAPDPEQMKSLINLWYQIIETSNTMTSRNITNPFDQSETLNQLQLHSLVSNWVRELFHILRDQSIPPVQLDSRIQMVSRFVQENMKEKITMDSLAKVTHTSESHLRNLFSTGLGISPMEYVRRLKIDKARELLLDTELPIQEISNLLGFPDATTFSRMFQKYERKSPRVYRSYDRKF
ncbi:helix-turn-helix domain-containing protein [Sporosarcina soli]|uniref:Helix-turn-helix domain-containing protein n=1 Tax=Sporosarcina soli TaxID=334736 RepID=A0ABW0TLE1_9BACL